MAKAKQAPQMVSVKDLAVEANTTAKKLRKILRKSELMKPSDRWTWSEGSTDLTKAREICGVKK